MILLKAEKDHLGIDMIVKTEYMFDDGDYDKAFDSQDTLIEQGWTVVWVFYPKVTEDRYINFMMERINNENKTENE